MQKSIYYLPGRGGRLDTGLGQHLLQRGYDVTGRAAVDEFNRLSFAEQVDSVNADEQELHELIHFVSALVGVQSPVQQQKAMRLN